MTARHLPGSLEEQFEELERDVKARELRERQARCPHTDTIDLPEMGGPTQTLCQRCGLVVESSA